MWLAQRFHKQFYWEHIQPEVIVRYDARGVGPLDVRRFFVNPQLEELQRIVQERHSPGELRLWVRLNISPRQDERDFWQFPFETLQKGKGDCEDMAILLANLIRAAGEEDWRVRIHVGEVQDAGWHSWVEWFDGESWKILDPALFALPSRYKSYFCWNSESCYTTLENIKKWVES